MSTRLPVGSLVVIPVSNGYGKAYARDSSGNEVILDIPMTGELLADATIEPDPDAPGLIRLASEASIRLTESAGFHRSTSTTLMLLTAARGSVFRVYEHDPITVLRSGPSMSPGVDRLLGWAESSNRSKALISGGLFILATVIAVVASK